MERIKITSRFEFPLELNMKNFMSRESLSTTSEDEFKYELYAFIVHRGTPYSGHYFSYVRDMNKEGNWEMEEVKDFVKEPEIVKEKEDIKENENGSGNIIVEKNEENKKNSKKNCVKNNGKIIKQLISSYFRFLQCNKTPYYGYFIVLLGIFILLFPILRKCEENIRNTEIKSFITFTPGVKVTDGRKPVFCKSLVYCVWGWRVA